MMRIPILMYHSVSAHPPGGGPSPGYTVTPGQFRGHLEYLKDRGIATLSLQDLSRAGRGEGDFPAPAVVLTFDDGYRDNHETVLPLLLEFKARAAFFLIASQIGGEGMMGWSEAGKLLGAGMEIGSHGMTHTLLRGKPREKLLWELEESKRRISARLHAEVDFFSLPRGYLPSALPELAERAGYRGMCTSIPGYNTRQTDPFRWRRFPLREDTSREAFASLVQQTGWARWGVCLKERARAAWRRRPLLRVPLR